MLQIHPNATLGLFANADLQFLKTTNGGASVVFGIGAAYVIGWNLHHNVGMG